MVVLRRAAHAAAEALLVLLLFMLLLARPIAWDFMATDIAVYSPPCA
jgi:hypothetical protein